MTSLVRVENFMVVDNEYDLVQQSGKVEIKRVHGKKIKILTLLSTVHILQAPNSNPRM